MSLCYVIPLLQHDSEPNCIAQGLITALDTLAPLNLPRVVSRCGAVDAPAMIDSIGHTRQFTSLQEIILYIFICAGRPRRPPYRCAEP